MLNQYANLNNSLEYIFWDLDSLKQGLCYAKASDLVVSWDSHIYALMHSILFSCSCHF